MNIDAPRLEAIARKTFHRPQRRMSRKNGKTEQERLKSQTNPRDCWGKGQ
ncbi:hypothetical protein PCH70_03010 [Pseudomonas cichorii JBC1]|nr:hypothetical protein PCH70_03010 [Pseudomonas cichorii JBC1]